MIAVTENYYITAEERILDGEPIIKGTRTPVRAIVEIWRLGVPAELVPKRLSHLSKSSKTITNNRNPHLRKTCTPI